MNLQVYKIMSQSIVFINQQILTLFILQLKDKFKLEFW